jgi:hypothetical protein
MSKLVIKGTVVKVFNTEERGPNGQYLSRKVRMDISTNSFENVVDITFKGDKINIPDQLYKDALVEAEVYLNGRVYLNKENQEVNFLELIVSSVAFLEKKKL